MEKRILLTMFLSIALLAVPANVISMYDVDMAAQDEQNEDFGGDTSMFDSLDDDDMLEDDEEDTDDDDYSYDILEDDEDDMYSYNLPEDEDDENMIE